MANNIEPLNDFTKAVNDYWDNNPEIHALGTQPLSVSMPDKLWLAVQMYHGIMSDEYGTPGAMAAHLLAQAVGYNDSSVISRIGGKRLSEAEKERRKKEREEQTKRAREAAQRFKEEREHANRTTDIAALRGSLDAKEQAELEKAGKLDAQKVA